MRLNSLKSAAMDCPSAHGGSEIIRSVAWANCSRGRCGTVWTGGHPRTVYSPRSIPALLFGVAEERTENTYDTQSLDLKQVYQPADGDYLTGPPIRHNVS
jgi:hypothetical protein